MGWYDLILFRSFFCFLNVVGYVQHMLILLFGTLFVKFGVVLRLVTDSAIHTDNFFKMVSLCGGWRASAEPSKKIFQPST